MLFRSNAVVDDNKGAREYPFSFKPADCQCVVKHICKSHLHLTQVDRILADLEQTMFSVSYLLFPFSFVEHHKFCHDMSDCVILPIGIDCCPDNMRM